MTREDREHEIDDYIAYLDALAGHVVRNSATRVIALGFSQGAQTVSRWAVRGATRMNHVILCSAGPATDLEPAPDMFRGARATFAVGDADEYLSGAEATRQHARLTAAGVHCELLRYQGGHRIEADLLRQLTMV
jgi:predicted esterase